MINLVTAVSRFENLPRLCKSISMSLTRSSLKATWILVVDAGERIPPHVLEKFSEVPFEIKTLVHEGGKCAYGIEQKNLGMSSISNGFYHCIDDDNIVHQDFFPGIEKAMTENPGKKAFVFGQKRWDNVRSLSASPDRMVYGKVDNTMFLVHSDLIGDHRYDSSRSGSEDFHFFRKLYDLYKDEFVFISETLSYYNFIKYFPKETKEEKSARKDPAPEITVVPQRSSASTLSNPRSPKVLKVALYSSNRERCGISTYTSQLEIALSQLGHDVRHFGSQPPYDSTFLEIRNWKPNIFHIQHETAIMPPEPVLIRQASLIARGGARVLVTLHTDSDGAIKHARELTEFRKNRIVVHRPTTSAVEAVVIPMPCTVFGAIPDRAELRKRFGFPEDAFILSTVGFMIPWKDHPRIADALSPWISENPKVHLQIIASEHFSKDLKGYADSCRGDISKISKKIQGNRIRHVDWYPSDLEIIERLIISDLGYVWCPFDTGSSSAAAAQFTTARCPLVSSDSSHYTFLGSGLVRAKRSDFSSFVRMIRETAGNATLLGTLRKNQWTMYLERNYLEVARRHIELYRGD
jgi:glycosyltransferase involved in cell wall biosynthesis